MGLSIHTMLDHKKLAVIHITKKELGLEDREYRNTLEKVTGVRSSRDLDEAGFRKLMRYFARSKHYRINADGMTFRQKLYIRHLVEDLGWDDQHFINFLKKYYHTDAVEKLSKSAASKLIESLKKIIARKLAAS
ncbi:MAG TPA: DUF1018 domain-containing protein [Desulfobacteraceae bacterium]|nr:DUF1018 domain-containing protein [Desulfobacteraceae bacterium]